MSLTVGSLFSGIGGLDLGLERAGMSVRWQAEVDPYCCRVLAKHWPDTPNLGDVTSIDWSGVEPVDLICGGYPCQPFSLAGARRGEHDPRHLWPHMLDAIRVLRPRYAFLENVPGHLALGFGDVLADLATCGYDTEWDCIPAAAVGAPHLRDRVFVVAHADSEFLRQQPVAISGPLVARVDGTSQPVADPEGVTVRAGLRAGEAAELRRRRPSDRSGPLDPWAVEPDVGRVADGVPSRVDRLRGLGNAVVPQVAEYVGRRLLDADERRAVERLSAGVTDVPACGVVDEIGERGDELFVAAVGLDGDGDGVGHVAECDLPARDVKGVSCLR